MTLSLLLWKVLLNKFQGPMIVLISATTWCKRRKVESAKLLAEQAASSYSERPRFLNSLLDPGSVHHHPMS